MSDIAEAAGISRQAVYLHFSSRTELMVATTHYVDEVLGLEDRLEKSRLASTGIEMLEAFVDFWGNYIPEIYSMGKVLMAALDTDEAAAAAWGDRMTAVRNRCRKIVETLHQERKLAPEWPLDEAADVLWTLLSVRNWEQLTIECGWPNDKYIAWMKTLLVRTLVVG